MNRLNTIDFIIVFIKRSKEHQKSPTQWPSLWFILIRVLNVDYGALPKKVHVSNTVSGFNDIESMPCSINQRAKSS